MSFPQNFCFSMYHYSIWLKSIQTVFNHQCLLWLKGQIHEKAQILQFNLSPLLIKSFIVHVLLLRASWRTPGYFYSKCLFVDWKHWSISDLESPNKGKIRIMISLFLRFCYLLRKIQPKCKFIAIKKMGGKLNNSNKCVYFI